MTCCFLQDNVTVGPSEPATVGGMMPPKGCEGALMLAGIVILCAIVRCDSGE